jgi:hypothetical protein
MGHMEINLDLEIKGLIEKQIESVYETNSMLNDPNNLEWIIESDKDLRSYEDFVLGYYLGSLFSIIKDQARMMMQAKENQRRFEEFKNELKTDPTKRMDIVIVELTNEQMDEIRDTIKRWSLHFRKKLNAEIQLRDLNKNKVKKK